MERQFTTTDVVLVSVCVVFFFLISITITWQHRSPGLQLWHWQTLPQAGWKRPQSRWSLCSEHDQSGRRSPSTDAGHCRRQLNTTGTAVNVNVTYHGDISTIRTVLMEDGPHLSHTLWQCLLWSHWQRQQWLDFCVPSGFGRNTAWRNRGAAQRDSTQTPSHSHTPED